MIYSRGLKVFHLKLSQFPYTPFDLLRVKLCKIAWHTLPLYEKVSVKYLTGKNLVQPEDEVKLNLQTSAMALLFL